MTEYSEKQKQCAAKILEIKTPLEANLVFSLYKQPELLENFDFKNEDFIVPGYKCLYQIISVMVLKEKVKEVNEVSVGMFLEAYDKLRTQYEELGGWETIQMGFDYNVEANFESDYNKNIKYSVLLKLLQVGFPIYDKLELKDENGQTWIDKDIQDIYEELDSDFQKIFIKANANFKVEDLADNGEELIKEWNEGALIGIPFKDFPLLTSLTGGLLEKSVILIGAPSNTGKSSLVRCMVLPSLVDCKESCFVILNEEDRAKWLREELIYIANNIQNENITKNQVRNGHYDDKTMNILLKALDYLKGLKQDHLLNFVSFPQYSTNQAIKTIRQASNNGIKNIIIDTFKCDNDRGAARIKAWEMLKENMVNLYNVARERNICILVTCQLNTDCRYLSRNNISESKGIIESASTAILMRSIWDDEKPGGKNAITVYQMEGKQKIIVPLDTNKQYMILFVDKSREGAARTIQIVAEVDWVHNKLKEIGFTNIPYNGTAVQ